MYKRQEILPRDFESSVQDNITVIPEVAYNKSVTYFTVIYYKTAVNFYHINVHRNATCNCLTKIQFKEGACISENNSEYSI